jgi:hypothetical protein
MLRKIVVIFAMAAAGASPAAASAMSLRQHVAIGASPRVAIATYHPGSPRLKDLGPLGFGVILGK